MTEENPMITEAVTLAPPATLKSLIEALIFAASEPVSIKELQSICDDNDTEGGERKMQEIEIDNLISEMNQEYEVSERPYRIVRIAGGYYFATLPEYATWIGKLYKVQSRRKLSQSSVETLAIIAYKQPISKPEVEAIRGVNCDYVLKTLLEKELVTIVGRAPTVGRPLLYGTTKEFLKHFGLNEISDLPRPREVEELMGDTRYETERRMLEAQEVAAKEKEEEEEFKSRLPHIPRKKSNLDRSVRIISKKKPSALNITADDKEEIKEEASGSQEELMLTAGPEPEMDEKVGSVEAVVDGSPTEAESVELLTAHEVALQEEPSIEELASTPDAAEILGQGTNQDSELQVEDGETNDLQLDDRTIAPKAQSKWQFWKEKIQGFMKKLFA